MNEYYEVWGGEGERMALAGTFTLLDSAQALTDMDNGSVPGGLIFHITYTDGVRTSTPVLD